MQAPVPPPAKAPVRTACGVAKRPRRCGTAPPRDGRRRGPVPNHTFAPGEAPVARSSKVPEGAVEHAPVALAWSSRVPHGGGHGTREVRVRGRAAQRRAGM